MAIITISRGTMSGGRRLAECLAETLGVPCLGREELAEAAAARLGVLPDVLRQKLESAPGLWDRLTSERRRYVTAAQAALAEHAVEGGLVYHGHAGHLLLRGVPAVLRIRLIAPLATRVRLLMEEHGMKREAAIEYIRQVDLERARWTRFIYDADLREPELYDLVVDLETLSLKSACAVIAEAARQPEFAVTEEVRATLRDFALSCRVKVALATDPATRPLELEVSAAAGVVSIEGTVPEAAMLTHVSSRLHQEVREVALAVEGVREVGLELREFDAYH